jgi:maltooligosyltrehalose trehalohydrolase
VSNLGVQPLRHGPVVHDDGTVTFRVWAPRADRVEVVLDGRHEALNPGEHGWFARRLPAPGDGRYAFSLDGGDPRPDPASQRQPAGVHAPSAIVDRAFAWSDAEDRWQPTPLASAVIYELHVGTFTDAGTFDAAAQHLANLAALGVTHVEVMPVAAFNGPRGWGYDGVAWYAVHEPYGGPEAFAVFVDACHRHGLAVILDVVYNHFGPSGSYHAELGPYLTDRHVTPWGPAINLDDEGADTVRAFIVDNASMWLADFHVDGLRLDAVHALVDGSAVHILERLSATVDRLAEQLGRPLVLIAESDRQDPRTVAPRAVGGRGLTAQWLDDLHHALHVTVTGERDGYYADYTGLPDLATAWTDGFVYGGRRSQVRDRTVGAPLPTDVSARHFVACVQNHDQIGNRAHGERVTTLADGDRVRAAIALLCLSPTVPMLFMGEEYGETRPFQFFTSHPEERLAEAVRIGRREEFAAFAAFGGTEVPDPQDVETFKTSTLDRGAAAMPEGRARRRLWTDLLALRRTVPALANGDRRLVRPLHVTSTELAIERDGPGAASPVVVLANVADRPARIAPLHGHWMVAWSSAAAAYGGPDTPVTIAPDDDGAACTVPPRSVALLTPTRAPYARRPVDAAGSGA